MGAFESMNIVRHFYLAAVDRVEVRNNLSSENSDQSWTVQRVRGPEFQKPFVFTRSPLHCLPVLYSVQSHALPCADLPKDLTKCGNESLFQN